MTMIEPQALIDRLGELGYMARPFDPRETGLAKDDREGAKILRALAVSGFAASNVMLLSVSVWSGADGATRDLFHWLSAMIALPAVAYAGRPVLLFRSECVASWPREHGRADFAGRAARSFMSLFETIHSRSMPISMRRSRCCSSCWPDDISIT
jgi:P-type Cu2+ transporter